MGCNEGRHARIAARHAGYVVAMDADDVVVDRLYEALAREGATNILPLTADALDPSPALGWRGAERRPAADRGRPDLVLALAVLHHLSIGAQRARRRDGGLAPRPDRRGVVEFATPDDPMVQRLLARKREDDHPDYRRDWFERCLAERFHTVRVEELAAGTRVLYHVRARS